MSLDTKAPKGYRKAWNGGKPPEDPRCPQCFRNGNVSPRDVDVMTGDSWWECSACGRTFKVLSGYDSPTTKEP